MFKMEIKLPPPPFALSNCYFRCPSTYIFDKKKKKHYRKNYHDSGMSSVGYILIWNDLSPIEFII